MDKQPLIEESSSYQTLLYRKNRTMRYVEIVIFLVGLGLIWSLLIYRTASFNIAVISLAVILYFISPLFYRIIAKPHYALYADRLEVRTGKKVESIPLVEIIREHDLPYIYRIRKKRTPVLVSNAFLDELNAQLEVIKRGSKKR